MQTFSRFTNNFLNCEHFQTREHFFEIRFFLKSMNIFWNSWKFYEIPNIISSSWTFLKFGTFSDLWTVLEIKSIKKKEEKRNKTGVGSPHMNRSKMHAGSGGTGLVVIWTYATNRSSDLAWNAGVCAWVSGLAQYDGFGRFYRSVLISFRTFLTFLLYVFVYQIFDFLFLFMCIFYSLLKFSFVFNSFLGFSYFSNKKSK